MQLEELTEQLMSAASLQEQQPPTQAQPVEGSAPDATKPALPPGLAANAGKTTAEILADLNRSPLFMTEMEEDNDDIAALQALDYEGSPLENASDFKERGNERFRARGGLPDAREFYTRGVLLLTAEERKRARGEVTRNPEGEADSEDEVAAQRATLAALHVNRAACQLGLENYRAAWLDCVAALRLDPRAVKAYYRAARALLRVDRVAEAADMCTRGLSFEPSNAPLGALAAEISARTAQLDERRRRDEDRREATRRQERLLRAALAARGIPTRSTPKPPEMEDARVRLGPGAGLAFPVLLLYPEHGESDFVKAFEETQSLADHLGYVFPLPWDAAGAYRLEAVSCYVETRDGGLLKMGKKASLLKVLSTGRVEVVDQLLRVFVLPTDKADGWIAKFKEQKAKEMGRA
ncbi:Tetratricopeptide-like helical [Cordyceps fumosorosea ARSEF 2679]|uniref:Tetratricopeptide-like helical n=1 Tax=Cordyceps fumosorosea (strain ARSEF 2679) TaxID=1081104 RepID=A0A167UAT0_CORFA|nr:Tetratricopeptide-like helical [Cordyceps fumosorosea ARSEF 2679]OAA61393.1 Tetratricopeptide-like helical [Cordyceps fumosorosea ARSEF 2679]